MSQACNWCLADGKSLVGNMLRLILRRQSFSRTITESIVLDFKGVHSSKQIRISMLQRLNSSLKKIPMLRPLTQHTLNRKITDSINDFLTGRLKSNRSRSHWPKLLKKRKLSRSMKVSTGLVDCTCARTSTSARMES